MPLFPCSLSADFPSSQEEWQITVSFHSQTLAPCFHKTMESPAPPGSSTERGCYRREQLHTPALSAASRDQTLPGIFSQLILKHCSSFQHLAPALARAVRTPTQPATGPALPCSVPAGAWGRVTTGRACPHGVPASPSQLWREMIVASVSTHSLKVNWTTTVSLFAVYRQFPPPAEYVYWFGRTLLWKGRNNDIF